MTLLLDGQKVQGKNLKVTANLRIESGDMSGQTSNTDKAHKGFKPKTLAVSLMIPFADKTQLTDLLRMADACPDLALSLTNVATGSIPAKAQGHSGKGPSFEAVDYSDLIARLTAANGDNAAALDQEKALLAKQPDNADAWLMQGDQLGGVIDFYFAGVDTFLFDLAVTANDWCIDLETGEFKIDSIQALLEGYQAVRSLSEPECRLWQDMLRSASLRFWTSRLFDFYMPREAEVLNVKDPRHFERVLLARRRGVPIAPQTV